MLTTNLPPSANGQIKTHLPSWEEQCGNIEQQNLAPGEWEGILRLKETPPRGLFAFARFLVKYATTDYTYKKFLDVSWGEIVDLIHDQALRNRDLCRKLYPDEATAPTQALAGKDTDFLAKGFGATLNPYSNRRHNQLPCTLFTTRQRVAEAQKLCSLDEPILVVGDDDMVGLELVRAGFRDVTSLDIDPKVCSYLSSQAAAENLKLKVVVQDIREQPPAELIRDYSLVFLDPMYSLAGIRLFLNCALTMSRQRAGTKFFLSLHTLSLLRQGLGQLPEVFDEFSLTCLAYKPGFNSYPIPSRLKTLIKLFNRKFMQTQVMASQDYIFPFFLSDAIVLEKNMGDARPPIRQ